MKPHSDALADLLFRIRQHAAFPELLEAVERPRLRTFNPARDVDLEISRNSWVYTSGRIKQHNDWVLFLTGQVKEIAHEEDS